MEPSRSTRQLAQIVSEWAEVREVTEDPYVSSLLDSLETEEGLDLQERLNPLEYLPTPSSSVGDRRMTFSNFLTVIRNVLVFVPVAITWKAVAEATDAFGRFTEENTATTVNFLQFWQNGYGYLDPFWGIANIAQIDFIIILAIIALTLFIGYLINSVQQIRVQQSQEIDLERLSLALEIQRALHGYRHIAPSEISDETRTAIQDLSVLGRSLVEVASALRETSREIDANRASVAQLETEVKASQVAWQQEVAQQLQLLTSGIHQSGDALEKSMKSLADSAGVLREGLDGALRQSLEESVTAFLTAASRVEDSSQSLNANSRVLQDDLVDLHRRLQRLLADGPQ